MYRYSSQFRPNSANTRRTIRVLTVLLILAVAGCVILGTLYLRTYTAESKGSSQLASNVRSCCMDAKNLAEKLGTSVQSNTASQLASIRQYVFAMDELNKVSISVYGEAGRLVPEEALSALYEDLNTYFSIIQTNTVSVLETRSLLINHLTALMGLLSE